MAGRFDYFVILAEMRTGSNFLESNLNAANGVRSYGEVFNPTFIGTANQTQLFGIGMATRDADPMVMIDAMRRETGGLPGFRLFSGHDPRVFEAALADPRCAKIVLSRNLIDSFVSLQIARKTDQWALGDLKNQRTARVDFDPAEFERFHALVRDRQQDIARRLQVTGQAAFYIDYEDIQDLDVLNGLLRFLGADETLQRHSGKFKKQNPGPVADKVTNIGVLEQAVSRIDRFNLGQLPQFEPRQGPQVPTYVAGIDAPLLFLPIRMAGDDRVRGWMAAIEGEDPLQTGFTQKTLRKWKRQHPGHRTFTVIAHPVARLHRAFCEFILATGPDTFGDIRQALIQSYGVPLPEDPHDPGYDRAAHRAAFTAFAKWVGGNLNGQTSIRVDRTWASQTAIVQGFGQFLPPDFMFREDELEPRLTALADRLGIAMQKVPAPPPHRPHDLQSIYDDTVEAAVRSAYQRDYMSFGFTAWKP